MSTIGDSFSFLPWVKNNLTTKAKVPTGTLPNGAPLSYRPELPVTVTLNVSGDGDPTLDVVRGVALHGPGDVIGLQPEAVLKTTPPAGEQQYPALLMASIEFGEEDLPWRYSFVDPAAGSAKVNPWCFLLVLKADEFTVLPQQSAPLPSILVTAPTEAFPAKETRWAWAHVQTNAQLGDDARGFTNTEAQDFLDQPLRQNPDLAFSRVLSPRRLEPNTAYHAFLVPAYETGRLAGLGAPLTTATAADQCAWGNGTAATPFPVYYQWEFRTSDGGDFESLARLLQPDPLVDFGTQPLALTTPLASAASNLPPSRQYILNLPGVIQNVGAPAMHVPLAIGADLYSTIRPASQPRRKRPILTPPVYGQSYATGATLQSLSPTATTWLSQVNLHPAYRSLAAIGSQVIQDNQEEYMQRAWEQVRDIIVANQNLRGMQQGLEATDSMRHQHLPVTGGIPRGAASVQSVDTNPATSSSSAQARGQNQAAAQEQPTGEAKAVSASDGNSGVNQAAPGDIPPAQNQEAIAAGGSGLDMENYGLHLAGLSFTRLRDPNTQLTLQETIRRSNVPLAAFSPTFRRIMKPFGPYQANLAGRPRRPTLPPLPANPDPDAPITLLEKNQNLQQRDAMLSLLVDGTITAAPPKYGLLLGYQFNDESIDQLMKSYQEIKTFWVVEGEGENAHHQLEGEAYGQFAQALASFAGLEFTPNEPEQPALDLPALKQAVIEGTRPGPVFLARANRAIRFLPHYGSYDSANTALAASTTADQSSANVAARGATGPVVVPTVNTPPVLTAVQPVMASPAFKDPMGKQLQQRHPDLFLPNIDKFPANTVALLEYNQAFIEAYMLGLNHAFGSELLWREYPTDLRGSYFRQFWDVSEFLLLNPPAGGSTVENLARQEEENRDIKPIHQWGSNQLGANRPPTSSTTPAFGDMLLLAVRADLLKRYPNTVVCAAPGKLPTPTSTTLEPDLTRVIYPVNRTTLGTDVLLFSFQVSAEEARGDFANGDWGYFFIFHERPGEPQFGADLPDSTAPLYTWNDLNWAHLGVPTTSVPNDNITAASLNSAAIAPSPGSPQPVNPFNSILSSADFAYATFQQPFLVAFHARSMFRSA